MELEINDLADQGVILHGLASPGFDSRFTALAWIPTVKVCLTFYGRKSLGDPVFIGGLA